jgi:hypothetical protein
MQFETPACTILFLYQNPSGHHPRFETYTNPFPCQIANPFFLLGVSKSLGFMILLARLKFCWHILNFAGLVFEAKRAPAKDSHQQNSAGARQCRHSEIQDLLLPATVLLPGLDNRFDST